MVINKSKELAKSLPEKQSQEVSQKGLIASYKNELILNPKTEKQLDSRLSQIEKELTPENQGQSLYAAHRVHQTDRTGEKINNELPFATTARLYHAASASASRPPAANAPNWFLPPPTPQRPSSPSQTKPTSRTIPSCAAITNPKTL